MSDRTLRGQGSTLCVCLSPGLGGGSPAPSSSHPHSFFLSSVLFHGPTLDSSRNNTGRHDAPSMLSTSPTPLLSAGVLIRRKCHICSGPHVKADNAPKDMQKSRHVSWQREGDRVPARGTCPPFQASGSSLGRKKSPRPGLTDRWNSSVSTELLGVQSGPGDSIGHHGPCPNAGASVRELGQDFCWERVSVFQSSGPPRRVHMRRGWRSHH